MKRRSVISLALGCSILSLSSLWPHVHAADAYPDRSMRMIVGYPVGGNVDTVARLVAEELGKVLHQPVVVDNRGGASGQIAAAAVAQAAPDGYTIFLGASPELAIAHALKKKLPYDSQTHFQPLSLATVIPFVLVVNPQVPVKSLQELRDYAKAHPGTLNYASFGNGSSNHLFAELFKSRTGMQMAHIPYKGGGPAMTDLLGGQVQMEFESLGVVMPHVVAGKLRALAVALPERTPLAPDVPTMAELGFPGLEGGTWNGFVGPAGMPEPIVEKLSAALQQAINSPSVSKVLLEKGLTPSATTPEEFGAFIASEIERWASVADTAGIRVE